MFKKLANCLVFSSLLASVALAAVSHGPFLLTTTKTIPGTTYVSIMDMTYPVTNSELQPGPCFAQFCSPDTWSNSAYYFLQIKAPNAEGLTFRWKRGNIYIAVDEVRPQDDGSIIVTSQIDFNLSNGNKTVTLQAKKTVAGNPSVTITPSNNVDYVMSGVTVTQP